MANILEFLRGVVTDAESQQLFRADPEGYVTRSGFGDLTGEDVVEAMLVLRRTLPPDVATALGTFEDESRLPAVRPGFGERELDAALRQLSFAVDLSTGAVPAAPPQPAPPPKPFWEQAVAASAEPVHEAAPAPAEADEPIELEAEPELVEPGPAAAPEPVPPPHPAAPAQEEPIRVEAQPPIIEPAPAAALPSLPSLQALDEALDEARDQLRAFVDDVLDKIAAAVGQAQQDADALRAEAEADRDAARQVLLDAREEAARIRADAEAEQAEIDARRAELREAERELKDRFASLDSVFRNVLKDE